MIQFDNFVHYRAIILLYQDIAMDAFGVTEDEVTNHNKEDSAEAKDISLLISQHIWEFLEFS